MNQPQFTLHKWAISHDEYSPRKTQTAEDELDKKSNSPQLRRRGTSQVSGIILNFCILDCEY